MHDIDVWREAPIVLAAPAQLAFVLIVALPWLGAGQWWKKWPTRALVFKSATLLVLILVAVTSYVLRWLIGRDSPWFDVATVAGYWAVTAAIYYQLVALIHERMDARRRDRD